MDDQLIGRVVKIFTKTKNIFIGIVIEWSADVGVLLISSKGESCRILSLSDIEAYTFIKRQENEMATTTKKQKNDDDKPTPPPVLTTQQQPIEKKQKKPTDIKSLLELRRLKAEEDFIEYKRTLTSDNITTTGESIYGSQYTALLQSTKHTGK